MKNQLNLIALAIIVLTCYGCTVDAPSAVQNESIAIPELDFAPITVEAASPCVGQDPQAKLINNSLLPANIEVFDQFGLLMTHAYGVPVATESPVLTFPDGMTTFVISTTDSTKSIKINMGECMIYEVTIDNLNQLDTDVPTPL